MKRLLSILAVIGIVMAAASCNPQPVIHPEIPTDTDYCKTGCEYLLTLPGRDGHPGCEEARVLELPSGDILTCEQFCVDTQNRGRSLCPSRWKEAKTCEDIEPLRLQCTPGTK